MNSLYPTNMSTNRDPSDSLLRWAQVKWAVNCVIVRLINCLYSKLQTSFFSFTTVYRGKQHVPDEANDLWLKIWQVTGPEHLTQWGFHLQLWYFVFKEALQIDCMDKQWINMSNGNINFSTALCFYQEILASLVFVFTCVLVLVNICKYKSYLSFSTCFLLSFLETTSVI